MKKTYTLNYFQHLTLATAIAAFLLCCNYACSQMATEMAAAQEETPIIIKSSQK